MFNNFDAMRLYPCNIFFKETENGFSEVAHAYGPPLDVGDVVNVFDQDAKTLRLKIERRECLTGADLHGENIAVNEQYIHRFEYVVKVIGGKTLE